uniref:Uncharacterized protein n=1 Tax=Oryza glumipatula TaxID=40148 RepID=A0A0E0AVR7_9ORYZ
MSENQASQRVAAEGGIFMPVQAKTEYQERKFSDMYRDRSLCKDLNQGQRIVIKRRRRGLIEQFTQISSARFALKAPVLFATSLD